MFSKLFGKKTAVSSPLSLPFPDFTYSLLLPEAPAPAMLALFAKTLWPQGTVEVIFPAVHVKGPQTGQAMVMNMPSPIAMPVIAGALEGDQGKHEAASHRAHLMVFDKTPADRGARLAAFSRLVSAASFVMAEWAIAGPQEAGLLPITRFAAMPEAMALGSIGRVGSPLPKELGGGFVLSTRGLSLFTGYEVGLQAYTPQEALGMMNMLSMVSLIALTSPSTFKEGDKVDVSENAHRFVRVWKNSSAGVPIMVLFNKTK